MKSTCPYKQPANSIQLTSRESKRLFSLTFSAALVMTAQQGFGHPATGSHSRLEDRGITPYAVFATEFLSNVDGGIRNGTTAPGLLDFGVEVDLEQLLGWQGAGFTATAFAAYGDDGSAENIGDFNVASNLFTDTDFNIFNLFVSQTFGDDFFYIKAGQIAADDDFMGSETAGLFLNSAFGPLPTESGNVGAPIFPLAAPGVFARVNPSDTFSFHAGIYAGDAGPVQSGNHGFDWRTGGAAGWVSFVEADYKYGSGTAKVGGYYHTGDFTNFSTNATEEGLGAIYAIIDHRFLEAADGGPGLSGFLRGSTVPQNERATVSHYFDGGLALDNLFREGDALGLGVSYTVFGDDYLAATPGVTSSETVLEMTYQVAITDYWMIQPDIQWILDSHEAQNDAFVVGVRTELTF
jgi:porin